MRSSTNYLLSKDNVGRAKPATRTLPPGGHTFGYKEKPDACGVRGCKLKKSCLYNLSFNPFPSI